MTYFEHIEINHIEESQKSVLLQNNNTTPRPNQIISIHFLKGRFCRDTHIHVYIHIQLSVSICKFYGFTNPKNLCSGFLNLSGDASLG